VLVLNTILGGIYFFLQKPKNKKQIKKTKHKKQIKNKKQKTNQIISIIYFMG
jgi:hypothetical protein